MVMFRSSALALLPLVLLVAAASGQQNQQRQQYRTNQTQQRRPAATQYGQQPQYTQQPQYSQQQQPQYRQQTQQRTTDRTYSATTDEYGRTRASGADHKIAILLANCNKAQIKLARYALDRAESSDVRSFADSLQQDHDLTLRQLRRFAPEVANTDSSSSRGYGDQGQRRTVRAWDDATVAQQISDRLVRKARDELSEKEGEEFDHCFVGQQLVAHGQEIAKMEVYRQYASAELRQVIDEAIEIAEGHEQEARELANDIRGGHSRDEREEYAGSERRDRYSRDESSDWDDEGRVERASYQERRTSRDDEDRTSRDRDDAEDDDEMDDDDRSSRDRDEDEDEDEADDDDDDDDDDRRDRDDRTEQYFRDRDR